MKSKIGIILTGLYILLVVYSYVEDIGCGGMFCGLGLAILGVPWTLVMFGFTTPDSSNIIFFLLLNAVIVYFIGLAITKLIRFIKK